MSSHWKRAILLIDMDAFFASVEQLDDPSLMGRPVAVTNGEQGSTIITASYEARRYGIKTGTKLKDARMRCPDLVVSGSSHERYGEVSKQIMQALRSYITPDIEIFSIDEAFLDVTRCQRLLGDPVSIAEQAQKVVWEASGLTCSVGVGGDKTTAKFAAGLQKPAGLTVIPPWEAEETLASVAVSRLCGIGPAITQFLAKHGVRMCCEMKKIPVSVLTKRFGPFGYRMWMMCQGRDPAPVNSDIQPPKSVGNGKVLPPQTSEKQPVLTMFLRMSETVASRLRRNEQWAQHYLVAMRINFSGWVKHKIRLLVPASDGGEIYAACENLVAEYWHRGITVQQVQVTALDPSPAGQQTDLFYQSSPQIDNKNQVIDAINQQFGTGTIKAARILKK